MAVNIRIDGRAVVLSNFGRLMNDPRHFDAIRDVGAMLDRGHRQFIMELRAVNEMGDSGVGLLVTITRKIRQAGGDVVLAGPSRSMARVLDEMMLDDFWEVFDGVEAAKAYLDQPSALPQADQE